ncbi:prepilin-type N-terminal cleavage/methylation domain-containing protein [Piscinibacter koreensis]|uniref:Prepilin-type N-terminal cleavage/methylation domain-containing protein n=1 Tax=Piscinibacter koreensis TaxID=2742824 RepID=A0A7Y6NQ01_9BURK|nr:prepilin-type N-terminal cleavage/methylation domain-containing protein [Schlegelella koreensis]
MDGTRRASFGAASARCDRRRAPRDQRGNTLIEALVSFLVFALGLLAVAGLQQRLRLDADIARQRSEAARLGVGEIEGVRAFAQLASAPGIGSFDAIGAHLRSVDRVGGHALNTRYRIERRVEHAGAALKTIRVDVGWSDRFGTTRNLALDTLVARSAPELSGALVLPRTGPTLRGARARSAIVPLGARDLGDGRSVFKPGESGVLAYVFDNVSGDIVARCTVDTATPTRSLTAAALGDCDTLRGLLLSGTIRFSAGADPAAANDAPLPLEVTLALTGGRYPAAATCTTEATKSVQAELGGVLQTTLVPLPATPASLGASRWLELGERFVAYHCVIEPLASGRWSGRLTLRLAGWRIGNANTERRVCRYSPDLDGSGAIDRPIEHPASYVDVAEALSQQNYLVIPGDRSCPDGVASNGALATLPHQP